MKKLLILLSAAAVIMSACSKEPSFEDPSRTPGTPGGGGNTNGTKLTQIGVRLGDDTLTLDYEYNSLDRVTGLYYSGMYDGEFIDFRFSFNRNAADIITSVTLKSPLLLSAGYDVDTVAIKFAYDAPANRYRYGVAHYRLDDQDYADSAVYAFDGTNRLSSQQFYFDVDNTGYALEAKEEYNYSGVNLSGLTFSFFNSVDFDLAQTESYEYDTNKNPQQAVTDVAVFGTLDYLFNLPFFDVLYYASANNTTKGTTVLQAAPTETVSATIGYSYNANNLPSIATVTPNVSDPYTITYHYQ